MITFHEAMLLAQKKIQELSPEIPCVILDDYTTDFGDGWIFFYQSKKYVETNNDDFILFGNGPIMIDKKQGIVYLARSGGNTNDWIKDFRRHLNDLKR